MGCCLSCISNFTCLNIVQILIQSHSPEHVAEAGTRVGLHFSMKIEYTVDVESSVSKWIQLDVLVIGTSV